MKLVERLILILLLVFGAIALHQVVAKYLGIHHWDAMKSADWAAWVQAVGSVAAILGAYHLSERSHARSKSDADIEGLRNEIKTIHLIQAAITRSNSVTHFVMEQAARRPLKLFLMVNSVKFERELALIDSISPLQIPDPWVAIKVLNINPNMLPVISALKNIEARTKDDITYVVQIMVDEKLEKHIRSLQEYLGEVLIACQDAVQRREEQIRTHQSAHKL